MTQDLQNIPIDIHANRLLDWLVSRHHCTKDWPEKISVIRQKINEALKDMPENPTIAKILLGASPLNYYHCVNIVEVLKETEAESKNMFGMYGSRRMKDWQDIIKNYKKDNLYLVESSSILARNVIYEIPAMKRAIAKAEQTQIECRKKETTNKKQAHDFREKFIQSCAHLGLQFGDVDFRSADVKPPSIAAVGNQLISLMSKELPIIFDKIAKKSKDVEEAVRLYRNFVKSSIGLTESEERAVVGLLQFTIEKGNVTTYEWKHGEAPLKIEPPAITHGFSEDVDQDSPDADEGAIDFGDLNLNSDDVNLETGEIDWGGITMDDNADMGEIDFSVDNVELETTGIVLEEDGLEGGVARNEEALSILENPETRSVFIDELYELEGFLLQRIDETRNEKANEMMLSSHEDSISIEKLEKLHVQTSQLMAMFTETKTKQFLLVRESMRYVTRIAESLLQNLKLAKKMDYSSEQAVLKCKQLGEEAEQIKPKIHTLSKQCRELQVEISKEISGKYNNRPVYITGGV